MADSLPAAENAFDRWARRYARWTGERPWRTLGIMAVVIGLCGWYGSGIGIRSNMEDLFPEHTPAVQAARQARETLKSVSQMVVVFGSPDREANRRLALDFCDRLKGWPQISALECRRDISTFRKNAALFLPPKDLLKIEGDVREALRKATEKELVDDALTEGLEDDPTPTAAADQASPTDAAEPPTPSFALPTDEDLQKRFQAEDIREWNESPDGTVLGVKLFPTVSPQQVDESAVFVGRVNKLIKELQPSRYHPKMQIATSGDYSEMTEEIDNIKGGLVATSTIALGLIAAIQVLHFRRKRALILMTLPLLAGTALTTAFARGSVGYLNMITAFIFSMLFGMGNDFNVYTLSRYLEERAKGKHPLDAVTDMMGGLTGALGQAAATTSVAFFALVVLEFRGFSQFGLIAGVGVFLSLMATLAMFPPLVMALHGIRADRPVSESQAQGQRWLGWFADKRVARIALFGFVAVAVLAFFAARDLEFETNLRKLRTPPNKAAQQTAGMEARELEYQYRSQADRRPSSPILVVTDSLQDAYAVHDQLEAKKPQLTRLRQFMSMRTFVPTQQPEKLEIIKRIRELIQAKREALSGKDRTEADRALEMLQAKPMGPEDLPDFVRERFRDRSGGLGRFVLVYANGNLADAKSVQQVIDELGHFTVGAKHYTSTASFFILAEADAMVKKEGPIAVVLATVAVAVVVLWYFRSWTLLFYSFVPLLTSFLIFLGIARGVGFELNLFSVTTLPGIVGIAIDGVTHILHRFHAEGKDANLRLILQQVGGAAWVALITTCVGFGALLFQDNPGLQSIAWWATVGLLVSCLLSNIMVGAMLALFPPKSLGAKHS